MATNFSNTTPVAPSGNTNVQWQSDNSGNVSASITTPAISNLADVELMDPIAGEYLMYSGPSLDAWINVPLCLSQLTPSSATTAGITGEIVFDSGHIYVCTNGGVAGSATWKGVALTLVA